MRNYDKGNRVRSALAKHVRRQKTGLNNMKPGVAFVSATYEHNYLARTLERMDTEFGSFTTDEVAYMRGMAIISADAERAVKSRACQRGTREAAKKVQSLLRQFS